MPRGRHRHSPPLHRLLPPSAIAGVSVVCALGPWLFSEAYLLRGLAAGAAVTAVVGAVVMRRWDLQAGKRVAELTRARASDEWRFEEQVAELESDLEESRELRHRLEEKLRAKRAELAGLRNEHAALLRRYATAESERASALEGRRLLAIETSSTPAPALALPAGGSAVEEAVPALEPAPAASGADEPASGVEGADAGERSTEAEATAEAAAKTAAPGVFSPAGSALFLRANSALNRIGSRSGSAKAAGALQAAANAETQANTEKAADEAEEGRSEEQPEAVDGHGPTAAGEPVPADSPAGAEPSAPSESPEFSESPEPFKAPDSAQPSGPTATTTGDGSIASEEASSPSAPALPDRSSGHFTVPTAVAVVPGSPRRRPAVEGGFDFFGTQKNAAAVESERNEDLADVGGEEVLALHKGEGEPEFKPADGNAQGVGQVIDLTAHDETERINLQGLRSAVS